MQPENREGKLISEYKAKKKSEKVDQDSFFLYYYTIQFTVQYFIDDVEGKLDFWLENGCKTKKNFVSHLSWWFRGATVCWENNYDFFVPEVMSSINRMLKHSNGSLNLFCINFPT
jgi:hypothetical protein